MDCENCRKSRAKNLAWLNLPEAYLYVCRACAFDIVMNALENSLPIGDPNLDLDKMLEDAWEESKAELALKLQEANAGDEDPAVINEGEREMERERQSSRARQR